MTSWGCTMRTWTSASWWGTSGPWPMSPSTWWCPSGRRSSRTRWLHCYFHIFIFSRLSSILSWVLFDFGSFEAVDTTVLRFSMFADSTFADFRHSLIRHSLIRCSNAYLFQYCRWEKAARCGRRTMDQRLPPSSNMWTAHGLGNSILGPSWGRSLHLPTPYGISLRPLSAVTRELTTW